MKFKDAREGNKRKTEFAAAQQSFFSLRTAFAMALSQGREATLAGSPSIFRGEAKDRMDFADALARADMDMRIAETIQAAEMTGDVAVHFNLPKAGEPTPEPIKTGPSRLLLEPE